MTEREKFLERWSRKKREAVDEPAPSQTQALETDSKPAAAPPVSVESEKPFDLESLPSLESITAETDIRNFLHPAVPADLKREALRRAWSADPGIRDFVGLAENSGDFNDPTAMVGFGPIEPAEVARLMAQFALTPPPEEQKKPAQTAIETDDGKEPQPVETDSSPETVPVPELSAQSVTSDAASQKESLKQSKPESDDTA